MSTNPSTSRAQELRRPRRPAKLHAILLTLFLAFPAVGAILDLIEVLPDGKGDIDGLAGARGVAVSPEGRLVVVAGGDDDALSVFSRDASGDALSFAGAFFDEVGGVFGLDGASAVAVSPDGRSIYVTAEVDDTVVTFSRDPSSDSVAFADVQQNGVGGVFGLDGAAAVTVTPDGGHVLVAGRKDGALAIFSRDASADDLSFVELQTNGADGVFGLAGASAVAVHPGGGQVYATGEVDHALTVFDRDPETGELSFREAHVRGLEGIEGLAGASGVAVSPDGRHVYATGLEDDSVAVFARAGPGLTFVEVHFGSADGPGTGGEIDGLDGAEAVAVSPDGAFVLVAGGLNDAIAIFRRDAATGRLEFSCTVSDAMIGIRGLDGVAEIVVSPDGLHLYAAARAESALTSFRLLQLLFRDDFESGDARRWANAQK